MDDLISRRQALKEMWKALYEYEDKTEKQFQELKDLDVRDWIMNDRLWVQNGHNLCVNVLVNLPSAQTEENLKSCKDCIHLGHAYMMLCKNCRRNKMLPDWYEVDNNG